MMVFIHGSNLVILAESVGFEPTRPMLWVAVFETASLNHSDTSPNWSWSKFSQNAHSLYSARFQMSCGGWGKARASPSSVCETKYYSLCAGQNHIREICRHSSS